MSETCTHDCSTCGKDCSERKGAAGFAAPLNAASKVGKVIAVASGKGGVGKSFVTTMLAVAAMKRGLRVGILDADITGPSIPKGFGLSGASYKSDDGIEPTMTNGGIKLISLNMLVEDPSDPVVWRGPVIAGCVKQFWTDVHWGELDVMFVDMPPGTGDVPLTVFQSVPLDGIIVVTSPQELVGMIVEKAVNMAGMMHVPVLGLVENLSYVKCPDCGRIIHPFGKSRLDETAARLGVAGSAQLPIEPALAALCDCGNIEAFEGGWLDGMAERIEALPAKAF